MFYSYFIYLNNGSNNSWNNSSSNNSNNNVVRQGSKMSIKVEKIKKIGVIILALMVSFLVIYAIYSNRTRFYSAQIVRYTQVTVDEKTDMEKIISACAGDSSKEKIISEIKKVNNLRDLSNESVYGKTIYIPIVAN